MNEEEQNNKKGFVFNVPVAIVIAGIVIAGAVLYSGNSRNPSNQLAGAGESPKLNVESVTSKDHILGDPNAELIIIEFSDMECPFCKTFHQTMKRIIEVYGDSKDVAWVYRHFPLLSIHPKAHAEAQAAECAAELGGALGFWEFIDAVFEITPSNNGLDEALLPQIAEDVGVNRADFEACLASGKYADFIDESIQKAIAAGAQGTPHSIILTKDGETIPIFGAETFEQVKKKIDSILEK